LFAQGVIILQLPAAKKLHKRLRTASIWIRMHLTVVKPAPTGQLVLAAITTKGKTMKNFFNDENGAVTVDFVVLTAAILLVGFVAGTAISNGAIGLGNEVKATMDSMEPGQ
jgi:Flp pilus assembly pilin Flp